MIKKITMAQIQVRYEDGTIDTYNCDPGATQEITVTHDISSVSNEVRVLLVAKNIVIERKPN